MRRALFYAGLTTSFLGLSAAPLAAQGTSQVSPSDSPAIADQPGGEIIVTALKQNRSLLDTPASVTVLNAAEVSRANITSVSQVETIVPGLVLGQGASNSSSPFLRGLGTNSPIFSIELSIPMYYDGVYYGRGQDLGAPLYDLDSIQVIRGTQATLLGKNSSLGALSYTNRRPQRETGFGLTASHSFNIDQNHLDGFVNLPAGERAQVRAAFTASDEDGYYFNNFTGKPEVRNRDLSGRLSVAFQPNDAIDAVVIYQHDDRKLKGQAFEVLKDPAGNLTRRALATGQTTFNGVVDDIVSQASEALGSTARGPAAFNDQNVDRLTGIVDISLGEHTLTLQSAYVDSRYARSNDLDFTAGSLFNLTESEQSETLSQELRLTSPSGNALSYLFGLFYFKNDWKLDRFYNGTSASPAIFPFSGLSRSILGIDTRTLSAFGSVTLELLPSLKATLGGRYTNERKDIDFERSGSGTFTTVAFPVIAPLSLRQKVNPFDYNASLEYTLSNSILVYGSYGKGSKSGGFQDSPTTAAGGPYQPEAAYSAEVGAKANLGSGNYVTAALFHTRVKNYQTAFTGADANGVSQTLIGNSNIRSQGFDVSAAYRPIPGLSFNGGVVYADAQFTDPFPAATAAIANAGDKLIRAPKWNGNVAVNFDSELSDRLTLFAAADVRFSSSYLHQLTKGRPDAPRSGSYQVLGATIGLRDEAGWEVSVIGTNLTNQRYINFATPVSFTGGVGTQAYYGNRNRPRVIAVQLKLDM